MVIFDYTHYSKPKSCINVNTHKFLIKVFSNNIDYDTHSVQYGSIYKVQVPIGYINIKYSFSHNQYHKMTDFNLKDNEYAIIESEYFPTYSFGCFLFTITLPIKHEEPVFKLKILSISSNKSENLHLTKHTRFVADAPRPTANRE